MNLGMRKLRPTAAEEFLTGLLDYSFVRTRVVEAQEFVLKDDAGRVYARLTLNSVAKPQFGMFVSAPPGSAGLQDL